eukprot:15330064-Ditylum_brightwellii.AAC.1
MARPPPEPPPMLTTTNNKEYRHMDTQENDKKHKENSITKNYSREQSKKRKQSQKDGNKDFYSARQGHGKHIKQQQKQTSLI